MQTTTVIDIYIYIDVIWQMPLSIEIYVYLIYTTK